MLDLIIDETRASSFGLYVYERPNLPTPQMRIEEIIVNGRDGALTKKQGYSNIKLSIDLNIMEDFLKQRIRNIKSWLTNAKRLSFSDDYGYYYKVKYTNIDDIENDIYCYGKFKVDFTCDPFVYATFGDKLRVLKSKEILNIGAYESRPFFRLTGKGDLYLIINNKRLDIKDVTDYVEIDSDIYSCTRDTLNMLPNMTGDFPILKVGINKIGTNCEKIEYMSRERYI